MSSFATNTHIHRSYNETIIRPVTRVLHGGGGGGSRGGQSAATSHRSNRSHVTSEVSAMID